MLHSRKGDRHFQKTATYIIPVTCFMYRLSWSLMEQFMGMPVICKGRDQPVHQQSQHLSGELCRRATLCFPSHLLRGPLDHSESRCSHHTQDQQHSWGFHQSTSIGHPGAVPRLWGYCSEWQHCPHGSLHSIPFA